MSNKRDLKRAINNISNDLFTECVAASLYTGKTSAENVKALLSSIIVTRNDFISRISHPEPGIKAKTYYDTLANDFSKQATELLDQITSLAE